MISISSSEIKVTGEEIYSFADIYDYAVDNDLTQYIFNHNRYYEISIDLRIDDKCIIRDSNVHIIINGDLIQIHAGAGLELGTINENGSTSNGCTLEAPNIKNAYGFGNTTKSDSGNLKLYNSVVNIYGFWGFFSGSNHVEIIDCFIDGFGRIEGSDSILKNILFKKSNGKYGILAPKGELKLIENLSVQNTEEAYGFKCSVYHNPGYAGNQKQIGGVYDGYDKLAYIEDTDGADSLIFLDSDIRAGYELERETNNVDFFHDFTFNPTTRDSDGNILEGVRIKCSDRNGNVLFESISDANGNIKEEITYYRTLRDETVGNIMTPHTLDVSYDDIAFTRSIMVDKPLINFPLYVTAGTSSDDGSESGCDCDVITKRVDDLESTLNTKLNLLESGIRQVIGTVIDEVNENETYFKETRFSITM